MMHTSELHLSLPDNEWPFEYTDHTRRIVRAIVFDGEGWFHFSQITRNDEFGCATLIETAGGGVEEGEDLPDDFICPLCKHGVADFEPIS